MLSGEWPDAWKILNFSSPIFMISPSFSLIFIGNFLPTNSVYVTKSSKSFLIFILRINKIYTISMNSSLSFEIIEGYLKIWISNIFFLQSFFFTEYTCTRRFKLTKNGLYFRKKWIFLGVDGYIFWNKLNYRILFFQMKSEIVTFLPFFLSKT